MAEESVEKAVILALQSEDAKDLAAEYAEVGLDAFLEEGLARDIPVVSTIVGLAKIGITIRDRLFAKKLFALMSDLSSVSAQERIEMLNRLEKDPTYNRSVGEHILELLDRIDSTRKPAMVGAVFRAFAANAIDARMLQRLCLAIERIPLHEVSELRRFCEAAEDKRDADRVTLEALQFAGVLSAASGWGQLVFQPNDVGAAFLNLDLDRV